MANPIFSASGMDFQFVSSFSQVWNTSNDYYSSAAGSFWDAQVDDDSFKPFGTLCVAQTSDPSWKPQTSDPTSYMLVARNTAFGNSGTPGDMPPLAPPSGFTLVWNDKNTGNTGGDGACWQIVPPDGYVALGSVFNNNGYNQPDAAHYWCIRADLVTQLGVGTAIWDDKGTGATTANMQCYGVSSIGAPPSSSSPGEQAPTGSWALDPGSFLTDSNYTVPSSLLNVILLPSVGQLMGSPGGAPQLTPNVAIAPASENTKVASMDVLFPMIDDQAMELDWKIAHPIYTIEIWGQWTEKESLSTTAISGVLQQQIESGIEQQASESWDNELGVTVSVNAEAEVGFLGVGGKASGGISASYSHTWAGSEGTITSTVTTIGVEANVPPATFAVLWQLNYTAYLRRQDGTYVGTVGASSQLNGYSLDMGTNNYSIGSVAFAPAGSALMIQSAAFTNVDLRMDGTGVTPSLTTGGGVVNCQYGPGPWQQLKVVPQSNGTFAVESVQFPGVYLRMDGAAVTQYMEGGGGVVNCQSGAGPFELFNLVPQGNGTVAIESVEFPGVYLRMDGTGVTAFMPTGGGVVNCQFGVGPTGNENFTIVTA